MSSEAREEGTLASEREREKEGMLAPSLCASAEQVQALTLQCCTGTVLRGCTFVKRFVK